jgi:hypothetical protein
MSKQWRPRPPPAAPAGDETVTVVSRKALERQLEPEKVQIGDWVYVNLGAGLLAELAAEMVLGQYPEAAVVRNGLDEVLLHRPGAAATGYEQMQLIVMVGL